MNTEEIAAKMGLISDQVQFLARCIEVGRCFIVTRPRMNMQGTKAIGRVIQGSSETEAGAMKTYEGWRGHSPILVHVANGQPKTLKAYHRK